MDTLTKFAQALGLVLILSLIIVGQGSVSDGIVSRAGDITAIPAAAVVSVHNKSIPEALGVVPGAFVFAVLRRLDTMFSVIGIGEQVSNPAFSAFIPWQEAAVVGGVLADLDEDGYSPEPISEPASYSDTSSNDYVSSPSVDTAPTSDQSAYGVGGTVYNDYAPASSDEYGSTDSGSQSWFPGFSAAENPYGNITDWFGGSSPSTQSGLDAAMNGFGFQFDGAGSGQGMFSPSLNAFSDSLDPKSGFTDTIPTDSVPTPSDTGEKTSFLDDVQNSFNSFFAPESDGASAVPPSDIGEKSFLQKTEDSFGSFFGGITPVSDMTADGLQKVAATENDMGKPSNQKPEEPKDELFYPSEDSILKTYEEARKNCAGDQSCMDRFEKCTIGPTFQSMLNLYGTVPIEIPGERESRAAGQAKLDQIQAECNSPSSSLIRPFPFAVTGSVRALMASVSAADDVSPAVLVQTILSTFIFLEKSMYRIAPAFVAGALADATDGSLDFSQQGVTVGSGGSFVSGGSDSFSGSGGAALGDGSGIQSWWSGGPGLSGLYTNSVGFLTGNSQPVGQAAPSTFDFAPAWITGATNPNTQDGSQDTSALLSGFSFSSVAGADANSGSVGGGLSTTSGTGGLPSGTSATSAITDTDGGSWASQTWSAITFGASSAVTKTESLFNDVYYALLNGSSSQGGGIAGTDVGNGGSNFSGSTNVTSGGSGFSGSNSSDSGLASGQSIVDSGTASSFIPGATTSPSSAFVQAGYTPTDGQSTRADCVTLATQAAQNERAEIEYLYVEKSGAGICMRGSSVGMGTMSADTQAMNDALASADSVSRIHTHPLNATFGMNVPPPALDVIFENGFVNTVNRQKLQMLAVDSAGNVWQYATTPAFNMQTDRVNLFVQNPQIQQFLQSQGIDVHSDSSAAITTSLSTAALGAFGRDLQDEAQTISTLPIGQIAQYQDSFNKQGSLTSADIDEAIQKYKAVGVTITRVQ